MPLTDKELETYTRKIIKYYFPHAKVNNQKVDPKLVVFAIYLHRQGIKATALIKAMEVLWKGSLDFKNMKSLSQLRVLLKDSVKESIKSYLKGEVSIMVKNTIRSKWRTNIQLYFTYGMDEHHPFNYIKRK